MCTNFPPATYLTHKLRKPYAVILGFYMPITSDEFDDLIQAGIPIDCSCDDCLYAFCLEIVNA